MHTIIDAEWSPKINALRLLCTSCAVIWIHRADKWITICPGCGSRDNLKNVRDNYTRGLTPNEK
jgi:hypothetical protein